MLNVFFGETGVNYSSMFVGRPAAGRLGFYMRNYRIDQGRLTERGKGLGTVTKGMVLNRAREIAIINGRDANQVLDSDVVQARRDLLGRELLDPVPSPEEQLPTSKRWDPVPGTPGHRAPTVAPADEQTVLEELVEEGVADAEHDRELAAVREKRRRDES